MNYKFILFFLVSTFLFEKSFANIEDPFTRTLGDGPSIIQDEGKTPNQTSQSSAGQDMSQAAQNDIPEKVSQTQQISVVSTPVTNTKIQPIGNILAPDPLIAYELTEYTLKGTALNSINKIGNISFNREGSKLKVDYGKIKTTHIVNQNDTVKSIAMKYGYTEDEIKIANSIVPGSKLVMGTKITLPARIHQVQKGQTLEMIAEIYNLDLKDLVGFNNLMPGDELRLGEKLLLPFYVYRTSDPETLKEIAKKFSRTVDELSSINNLKKEDNLNKDQYVKIPIFVNPVLNVESMKSKRGIMNYSINPKNLAILEVKGQQFMVREGDRLGIDDGYIVKITDHEMKVLQNYEEFKFQINAPILKQVASLPQSTIPPNASSVTQGEMSDNSSSTDNSNAQESTGQNTSSSAAAENSITNVEDLFN